MASNAECNRRSRVNGAKDLSTPFLTRARCNVQRNKMFSGGVRRCKAVVLCEVEQGLLPLVELSGMKHEQF